MMSLTGNATILDSRTNWDYSDNYINSAEVTVTEALDEKLLDSIIDAIPLDSVEGIFVKYLSDSKVLLLYVVIPEHDNNLEDSLFDAEEQVQNIVNRFSKKGNILVDLRFRLSQGRNALEVVPIPANPVFLNYDQ